MIHFCLFLAKMECHQKTLLYLVALLVGEILFFVLKAPQIHDNIKPSTPLRITKDDLDELHKRKMKSRFISRSSLSFCNHASNGELKGIKNISSPDIFLDQITNNLSFFYNKLRSILLQIVIYFAITQW